MHDGDDQQHRGEHRDPDRSGAKVVVAQTLQYDVASKNRQQHDNHDQRPQDREILADDGRDDANVAAHCGRSVRIARIRDFAISRSVIGRTSTLPTAPTCRISFWSTSASLTNAVSTQRNVFLDRSAASQLAGRSPATTPLWSPTVAVISRKRDLTSSTGS